MTRPRSKDERRRLAWAYQGNAQIFEVVVRPAGLDTLCRPNRVMEQHRSSHRRRRLASWPPGDGKPWPKVAAHLRSPPPIGDGRHKMA